MSKGFVYEGTVTEEEPELLLELRGILESLQGIGITIEEQIGVDDLIDIVGMKLLGEYLGEHLGHLMLKVGGKIVAKSLSSEVKRNQLVFALQGYCSVIL